MADFDTDIERRVTEWQLTQGIDKRRATVDELMEPIEVMEARIRRLTTVIYAVALSTGIIQFAYFPNFFYFKDVLREPAAAFTQFKSISMLPWSFKPIFGYFEDLLSPFGYKSKSWLILSCVLCALTSVGMYVVEPSASLFTVFNTLLNAAVVINDVMAQGLTIVVLNLKKVHAESVAIQERRRTSEIRESGIIGEAEGKKVFGNYNLLRFLTRNVGIFLGGILAKTIKITTVYGVIAVVQVIIMVVILMVKEQRQPNWINKGAGSLWGKIKSFLGSIMLPEIRYPLILILLCRITPDVTDAGSFVLTEELKWTSFQLSFNTFAAAVTYFVSMLFLVNLTKNTRFSIKVLLASLSSTLFNYCVIRFAFYEYFTFLPMYGSTILSTFLQNFSLEFFMIALVSRYSLVCPKGMETFGIAAITTLINFAGTVGGLLGSRLLTYYNVTSGNYDFLIYPVTISFGFSCLVFLTTPLLGK